MMDFSKLVIIDFDDLIPGNKYYIQKMGYRSGAVYPSGTSQKYGIFARLHENIYAVFSESYNFKNPYTNEYLVSGMAIGIFDAYCHRSHFIFYEPKLVTYNKKENELLGKVMGGIIGDTYMNECIVDQGWMGFEG